MANEAARRFVSAFNEFIPRRIENEDDHEKSRQAFFEEAARLLPHLQVEIEKTPRGDTLYTILVLRFGDGKTYEQVGKEMDMTREHVRQLEQKGLAFIQSLAV